MIYKNPEQEWLALTETFVPFSGRDTFPYDDKMRTYKGASVLLNFDHNNKKMAVNYFEAYPKKRGNGTRLIKLIQALCDKYGYDIVGGNPVPYDPTDSTNVKMTEQDYDRIHKFYKKRGFLIEGNPPFYLIYYAKKL